MSDDALQRITNLGKQLRDAQAEVKRLTAELAAAKAIQTRLEREALPELMREYDLDEFKLTDGAKVTIKDDLECAITEANKEAAHKWITKRGDDGIIKTVLLVEFDRDEREQAIKLAQKVRKLTNKPVEVSESVHPQTLKAYLRELLKKKVKVPIDLFSLHPFPKAKLTPAKGESGHGEATHEGSEPQGSRSGKPTRNDARSGVERTVSRRAAAPKRKPARR